MFEYVVQRDRIVGTLAILHQPIEVAEHPDTQMRRESHCMVWLELVSFARHSSLLHRVEEPAVSAAEVEQARTGRQDARIEIDVLEHYPPEPFVQAGLARMNWIVGIERAQVCRHRVLLHETATRASDVVDDQAMSQVEVTAAG